MQDGTAKQGRRAAEHGEIADIGHVLEALPGPVLLLDARGTIRAANTSAVELIGMARSALVGRSFGALLAREPALPLEQLLADTSTAPRWYADLLALHVAAGATVPVRLSLARFERSDSPVFVATLVESRTSIGADPPVRELAEPCEQLTAERERLATILAHSPGVVISFERLAPGRGRIPYVSAGAQALYGYSPQQVEADPNLLFKGVHPDDVSSMLAQLDESARHGTPLHHEFRYLHPTQGEKWLEHRAIPRIRPDGSVLWCGVVVDVTHRKRTEQALRLVQAHLESALAAGEMGAWIWNTERNELWGNEVQRTIWDLPPDTPEWFDANIVSRRIHPDDVERTRAATEAAVESGSRLETEFRLVAPDGSVRWICSRARVEREPGQTVRLAGISLDITEQKLAAEHALRSQKLEALGTLAGGIAHDFNNMLFAISGNAALALKQLRASSPAREHVEEIATASSRAAELVRQILDFSRPQQPKRETAELVEPIRESLRLVRATTPATIEIQAELDPATPAVHVDAARMVQVVVNLCGNAAHAIGRARRGLIAVRLEPEEISHASGDRVPPGRYAKLTVADNGCGIEESIQRRIFDPFFTTKSFGEGTGLGLSVVHGIVKALGGHLTVDSRLGEGATFCVYLPATTPEGARPQRSAEAPASAPNKRVLFVDDEHVIVRLGERFLGLLGYTPAVFRDPHQALAAFREAPDSFDAIVTDLSMPSMSGFELVRRIREVRPEAPVLLISGYLGPEERQTAAQLGIREVAPKPLSLGRLGELLGRIC